VRPLSHTCSALLLMVLAALLASGCRGQPSDETPIVPIRNMYQQARYGPQARSAFFADERTMRPLVVDTVAREMEVDLAIDSGFLEDGTGWVLETPQTVVDRFGGTEELLARGQGRFDIFCAPCHGLTGDGRGIVAQRAAARGGAALQPPTFHDDRIRHMPDGQLYATMSNGVRNMPAYDHMLPVDDRWAIVGYVRALQMSQRSQPHAMNLETDR